MDKGEFHFKEYERSLDLLNQSEKSLDRLALVRIVFLVFAFLFFRNYLTNFNEIQHIRLKVDSLAPAEKDSTVFGFIAAHQKVENSVFVPDERAQSLIELIPKLRTFLGEDLTLENQASRPVSEILLKATKKPEQISIENQYLPKLSIPVSYSTLGLFAYLVVLGSYFNFSFRRFRMGLLIIYLEYNLAQFQKCVGFDDQERSLVRSRLYIRRFCSARAALDLAADWKAVIETGRVQFKLLAQKIFSYLLETEGESPFRLLNAVVTVLLFVVLGVVTVEIVAGESGLPRGQLLVAVYLIVITVIPASILWILNTFVEARFRQEQMPFLPPSDEI